MRYALQKRADLSMSTIVMAIIALLILIVLATMIVRNLGGTNDQINRCENKGGVCAPNSCGDDYPNKVVQPTWICYGSDNKPSGQQCCV